MNYKMYVVAKNNTKTGVISVVDDSTSPNTKDVATHKCAELNASVCDVPHIFYTVEAESRFLK